MKNSEKINIVILVKKKCKKYLNNTDKKIYCANENFLELIY